MSYADFKREYEATHGELEVKPPYWEAARNRTYRPPAEPEGPVSTVVNGLTGDRYTVPRLGDEDVPEPVTHDPRPRKTGYWCEECGKRVGPRAAKTHVCQPKPKYLPPPDSRSAPRNLNSAGMPRRRRKQAFKAQGMAGYSTPRSQ